MFGTYRNKAAASLLLKHSVSASKTVLRISDPEIRPDQLFKGQLE
jgi:hypothetical protein